MRRWPRKPRSFNPCCSGSRSSTSKARKSWMHTSPRFNPCCSGSRSSTCYLDLKNENGYDVSILVVVDHGRRQAEHGGLCNAARVSILVVVDHGRRRPAAPIRPANLHLVSILVVVDHGRRPQAADSRMPASGVSILVVVDHGRRLAGVASGETRMNPRFNPCCSGSRSSTTELLHPTCILATSFNPCCSGSRSSTTLRLNEFTSDEAFQSLL